MLGTREMGARILVPYRAQPLRLVYPGGWGGAGIGLDLAAALQSGSRPWPDAQQLRTLCVTWAAARQRTDHVMAPSGCRASRRSQRFLHIITQCNTWDYRERPMPEVGLVYNSVAKSIGFSKSRSEPVACDARFRDCPR